MTFLRQRSSTNFSECQTPTEMYLRTFSRLRCAVADRKQVSPQLHPKAQSFFKRLVFEFKQVAVFTHSPLRTVIESCRRFGLNLD